LHTLVTINLMVYFLDLIVCVTSTLIFHTCLYGPKYTQVSK